MEKNITIIVLTSSICNLKCSYCYVRGSRKRLGKFNLENIGTLIQNCSIGFDSIEFCWHGGEPLLAGIDFYEEIIRVQSEIQRFSNVIFKNNIQTNGYLLDDNWFDFLQRNKFSIGLSLDSPPEIHKLHRRRDVDELISLYKRFSESKILLGVLCVVTKFNVNKAVEIFNFYKETGIKSFSFLPLKKVPLPDLPPSPTNEELFYLYQTIFDLWVKEGIFSSIEPIETIIRSLLGQKPNLCSFSSPCLKKMITITQDGEVVPCSSIVEDDFVLGNILESPLMKILHNNRTLRIRKFYQKQISNNCKGCEFISICRGGCKADCFWHSEKNEYPFCDARKKTFSYIKNWLLSKNLIKK